MNKKKIDDFADKVSSKTNYILEDTLLDKEAKNEDNKIFNYEDLVKNSPKAKMSKFLWIISIILILAISLYLVYTFLNGNPQSIFTNTIDKFFSSITENISDNNYDISKGKMNVSFDIDSSEKKELLDEISKMSLSFDYNMDSANNLLKLNMISKYENGDFIKLDIYNDKNNVYVYASDLYDKYVKIKNESKFKFIRPKDVKTILNGLNQAFDKVATSEKIYGKKTTLDFGNKTINVSETKLIIDSSNSNEISEVFINTLKANTEFVSALAKFRGTSNKDIQNSLERFLPKLKQFFKENEKFEVTLFNDRKTKEFVKGEMKGNVTTFTLLKNENNYSYSLNNKDLQKSSGNITFDVNDKKTEYNINIDFKNNINEVSNSGKIKLYFTNNKAKSFKRINTNDAKDINELSEIEKVGIYAKVFSNPKMANFIKFIK